MAFIGNRPIVQNVLYDEYGNSIGMGQKSMASSLPVVLASDQTRISMGLDGYSVGPVPVMVVSPNRMRTGVDGYSVAFAPVKLVSPNRVGISIDGYSIQPLPVRQGPRAAGSGAWPETLYDSSGHAVGVVLDGAIYRLQTQSKIVRDSDGAQINPATEDTLALIKAKTDNIPTLGQKTRTGSLPVTLASDQPPIIVTMANPLAIPVCVGFDRSDAFDGGAAGMYYIGASYTVPVGFRFTPSQFNAWSADNRVSVRVASLKTLGTWNPNTQVFTSSGSYTTPAFGAAIELAVTTAMGNVNDQVITISYTNESGVAGRTALAVGGLKLKKQTGVGYKLAFYLQAGDVGITSVQSITADVSNTGALEVHGIVPFYEQDLTAASTNYIVIPSVPNVVSTGDAVSVDYSSSAGATVRRYVKCVGVLESV